jgi:hypothetical protein
MADPSAAFRMPVKSAWFGRNDGHHLCYGERSFINDVSKNMKAWAWFNSFLLLIVLLVASYQPWQWLQRKLSISATAQSIVRTDA